MAKTLSRTKLPWGPRGYYEGKPSFRKTTALRKRNTKTKKGRELSGKSAFEKNKATTDDANTLLRTGGTPARSGYFGHRGSQGGGHYQRYSRNIKDQGLQSRP